MGIQGLTSFIDDNLQLLNDYQLHDSKVIIDGNNLFHLLYYSYNVDFVHGGDYDKFTRKIVEFFNILKSCKIEPYIILDGGYEPDNRKLKTILDRANIRIHLSGCIANGERGKILPVLAYEVFITSLNTLGIGHVTCDFEADNQIAVLANDLKCPVISFDSDFYILSLTHGFIPFDSVNFDVQPTATDSDGQQYKYLPVKIYFTQNFIQCFPKLDKQVLPLMATVLGNDYVHIKTFEEFYSALKVPKHGSSKFTISKTSTKMLKIISWLESLKNVESGIDKLVTSSKPEKRENVKTLVEKSMSAYSNVASYSSFSLYDFFNDQKTSLKNSQTLSYNGNSIPTWFIDFHRQGKIPVFMQNTLVLHRNILLCQVENLKMPSSYNCSLYLRQCLYSILLRDDLTEITMQEATKDWCVEEYDRQDGLKNLKKNLVQPLSSLECYGDIPGLKDIEHMDCNKRIEFLYKVFDIRFEGNTVLSDDIKLFVMTIIFWIRHADPQTNKNMVKALVMCWVSLSARIYATEIDVDESQLNVTFKKSSSQQRAKLKTNMDKYFHVPQHSRKYPIDISIIHGFSQFQTCYLSTIHLNQILRYPLPAMDPASVFNGSFLYNFCKDLQMRTNPDLFISEMLVKQSPTLSLYQSIISEILSQVGEEFFRTASSPTKRTRNRKKQKKTDKLVDREPGTSACNENSSEDEKCKHGPPSVKPNITATCELTNRFNFLDIDDLE